MPCVAIDFARHAACMALCGALLGPVLDATESNTGVLTYSAPDVHLLGLETCTWVPLLFALAAVIIGTTTVVCEHYFSLLSENDEYDPSWEVVAGAVLSFSLQYAATGVLFILGWKQNSISLLLYPCAILHHLFWDDSFMSTVMAVATACGGPAIEVLLIHHGAYTYAEGSVFGILPTWIFATYFAGGAANVLLGRAIWWHLRRSKVTDCDGKGDKPD
jgi:hypothetical protein